MGRWNVELEVAVEEITFRKRRSNVGKDINESSYKDDRKRWLKVEF